MKVNYFGLRLNKGVTVATFVTTAPVTASRSLPPSVSCTREVVSAVNESPRCWPARLYGPSRPQHPGITPRSPVATSAEQVLTVMCSLTESLCDYEFTGKWTLSQFPSEMVFHYDIEFTNVTID